MSLMQTLTAHLMTEAEFLRLPDYGRKWELVNGGVKEVPTSFLHDPIVFLLSQLLGPFLRGRGGISLGQAGFRMRGGNVRVPDLSFTRRERLPGGSVPNTFGEAAPDLCVEIISPSEDRADMACKVEEYFASGAVLVWHIFPDTQTVLVFTSPAHSITLNAGDTLTGGDLLPGFSCHVADLFVLD